MPNIVRIHATKWGGVSKEDGDISTVSVEIRIPDCRVRPSGPDVLKVLGLAERSLAFGFVLG